MESILLSVPGCREPFEYCPLISADSVDPAKTEGGDAALIEKRGEFYTLLQCNMPNIFETDDKS